jgi:hypothetical protein
MARKPISIWIGQVVIAVFSLFAAGVLVYAAFKQWPVIISAAAHNQSILVIALLETAAKLALVALFAWTVVLISKRSAFGRWLGLLCLAGVLAVQIYGYNYPSRSAWTYDTPGQQGAAFIFQVVFVVAYVTLMTRFGFSKASKLYFAGAHGAA